MGVLNSLIDLYKLVPGFFLWVIPTLVGGYIAFLWSGYALGAWVNQAEISGLRAANEAARAQNDVLRAQNDVGKDKAGVMDERLKLAKEQTDDATKKAGELKSEVELLRQKVAINAPKDELTNAVEHLSIKASNVLTANNNVSFILTTPEGSKQTVTIVKSREGGPILKIK